LIDSLERKNVEGWIQGGISSNNNNNNNNNNNKVRTVTAFVTFEDSDFDGGAEILKTKIRQTHRESPASRLGAG